MKSLHTRFFRLGWEGVYNKGGMLLVYLQGLQV